MTSFAEYVQKRRMTPKELPLIHTTRYSRLQCIGTTHVLQTAPCRFFKNQPLLYFFYGRPAYRDPRDCDPITNPGPCPVCLVFKPGTVSNRAQRLFPFDSGASQIRLYEPAVKKETALMAYEISGAIENARRIVQHFFETDSRYMSNQPTLGLAFSNDEVDAEAYYKLLTGGGRKNCDDRRSAVEVQLAEPVDVRGQLMAIALPTCFLDNAHLEHTILKVWEATPITYFADDGIRPTEFHGTIRHLVRQFYVKEGIL